MSLSKSFLFAATLVCSIQLMVLASSEESSEENNIKELPYGVTEREVKQGGKCRHEISIKGRGVDDKFYVNCDHVKDDQLLLTADDVIIYKPSIDSHLLLYSNTPSTLVVFNGLKCSRRTYTTKNGKTSHESKDLTDDECAIEVGSVIRDEIQLSSSIDSSSSSSSEESSSEEETDGSSNKKH